MYSRGSRERHFANGAIAGFVQHGRLDPQPLEFVNANLHEQSHLQHSLFPASACDFCESIVGNGRPDPVLPRPDSRASTLVLLGDLNLVLLANRLAESPDHTTRSPRNSYTIV